MNKTILKHKSRRRLIRLHRQKGAALVIGLLLTMVSSMVAVNASKRTVAQQRMAHNYRFSIEAMNNADAGSVTAFTLVNDQLLIKNGFDDELDLNGDGALDDRFNLAFADTNNNVYFNVVVVDDDDGDDNPAVDSNGIVLLVSQGISAAGTTRTTEVRMGDTTGGEAVPVELDKAILTQEALNIVGNPAQFGSHQDIHSNADVSISGSPSTDGTVSAVGSVDVNGAPAGEIDIESGAAHVDLPHVDPAVYAAYADYVFESDGNIFDAGGNLVANAAGRAWQGWRLQKDTWTTSANSPAGGLLYFRGEKGNVHITGSPGSAANPWEVSMLADGYIRIEGSPIIDNYMNPDDPPEVQAILFLSGADILINGNASQTFAGIIAAREQIDISGNATIEGALIAADESHDSDLVMKNRIFGNMNISYDGGLSLLSDPEWGDGIAVLLSWRDREIARNTGPFAP